MIIPPLYKITPEILEQIVKIEANRIFLNSVTIPGPLKEKIQRVSLLKSSLYSARIEGNSLKLEDLDTTSDRQKKTEVFNILAGIKFTEKSSVKKNIVTKKELLDFHKFVMKDLSPDAGFYRREMGAIFNQAGAAIYLSPPPNQIHGLLDKMIDYINSGNEKFPLITAFISHLVFEKIHPFIDGNGRVGRLLILTILLKKNWKLSLNIPLEEYLDKHKEGYYFHLDTGLKKPEDYLLFMLNAFYEQSEKIKSQLEQESKTPQGIILPPRQEEIYSIIQDHKMVSLDVIKRRFLKVPSRTLRYDLKKLQQNGTIIKIGSTRGSLYTIKK